MQLVDEVRKRWRRFLCRDTSFDVDSQLEASRAELEFTQALKHMQDVRVSFDKRPSSRPPSDTQSTSISGLTQKLKLDDKLMREAIDNDESEDQ